MDVKFEDDTNRQPPDSALISKAGDHKNLRLIQCFKIDT